jgi:hypothetical protein
MKQLTASKVVKFLFMYAVLIFMALLTYRGAYAATGDPLVSLLALALFDGGAYAGYMIYKGHAQGEAQRAAAVTMIVVDFALAVGMIAGTLLLIPHNAVLWILLGAACFNGSALYFYHLNEPDLIQQIKENEIEDAEFDEHIQGLKRQVKLQRELHRTAAHLAAFDIEKQAPLLAAVLSRRNVAQIKKRMRLALSENERKEIEGEVVDVKAEDLPQLPAPAGDYVPEIIKRFFGIFAAYRQGLSSIRHISTTRRFASNTDAPQPEQEETPAP